MNRDEAAELRAAPYVDRCFREAQLFGDFACYAWLLETILYDDQVDRLPELYGRAIACAEAKARELSRK